jgi:CIC family chloride channel protein
MISNLIAYFISHRLQKEPIYEALAHQDGVHLPTAEARAQAGRVRVSQAMRVLPAVLSPETEIRTAIAQWTDHNLEAWPVADREGLCGMIRKAELERALSNGTAGKTLSDLLKQLPEEHATAIELPHVHPDHSFSLALERMGSSGLNVLPVVSRANVRQLLGVVVLNDILGAYGLGARTNPYDE